MMQSTYLNHNRNGDDDDEFAPNPFRTNNNNNNGMDFFETPSHPSMTATTATTMNYTQQPDPNTGMVGTVPPQLYYPQQQQQQPPHHQQQQQQPYLSGTMDQLGGNNNSTYSSNNKSQPPPSSSATNPNFLYSFLTSCCLPYETIQSLFDVDTIDIYIRIKATIFNFHQPNYFRLQILGAKRTGTSNNSDPDEDDVDGGTPSIHPNKGPDLYGPIWISMTCMFILGITANINDYYRHVQKQQHSNNSHSSSSGNNTDHGHDKDETIDEEFEYDLTHLLNAMYICFVYTFGISTFFWLVCICMGFNNGQHHTNNAGSSKYLSWVYWVCHYGYSLVPILIGTCFAWILPYTLYHWIVLGIATFVSSLFIIRNLSTPLLEQDVVTVPDHDPNHNGTFSNTGTTTTTSTHAKAAPILLSILGVHFTFLLVLKLTFYP